jgi:serine/threonine protein kinase
MSGEVRPSLLDVSAWDQREAVRTAANRELPGETLGDAVERLAMITLFALVVLGAELAALYLLASGELASLAALRPTFAPILGGGVGLSALFFAITRVKRLRAQAIVDFGYAYLVLLCLLLGMLRHGAPSEAAELLRHVSPIVFPILAFAALIPAPPTKVLIVSLFAAAMDPVALFLMRKHVHHTPIAIPLLLASPLAAALAAREIARVVHHLNEGIVKAREVGSYRLVAPLGVGGMAEVWRAEHRMLARPAAVKLIRSKVLIDHGPQDSERLIRLFTREARATAALNSPHTIMLYDFGVAREGAFYYVMELLDGVDLQRLVERFGPQPSERVSHFLRQACHSLREAHEQDFVHRDIKPANIFTCSLGGDFDFVKVLDFGLVRDGHPTSEEIEDEQRFVGTPAVMAPEMVRFQAPVDARADLYALGCVGYWLLSGKRVFEAQTRHDMLVMHAHQRPVVPSKRGDVKVHEGLEQVVMACLEKNPNRRPQTAQELMDRLAALEFAEPWTEERSRLWWKEHLSDRGAAARVTNPQAPRHDSI